MKRKVEVRLGAIVRNVAVGVARLQHGKCSHDYHSDYVLRYLHWKIVGVRIGNGGWVFRSKVPFVRWLSLMLSTSTSISYSLPPGSAPARYNKRLLLCSWDGLAA